LCGCQIEVHEEVLVKMRKHIGHGWMLAIGILLLSSACAGTPAATPAPTQPAAKPTTPPAPTAAATSAPSAAPTVAAVPTIAPQAATATKAPSAATATTAPPAASPTSAAAATKPAAAGPPAIPHAVDAAHTACTACHVIGGPTAPAGSPPAPIASVHQGFNDGMCQGCHKPKS
jgi:hypothetical protein